MAVTMQLYKTLYGNNPVYVFAGVESGKAADKVNDAIKAMADACEDMEEGVSGVGISTATINAQGHLILTKTDSTTVDAGVAVGSAGVSVTTATINSSGHLIITKSDTTTIDAGSAKGDNGVGISTATIDASGHLILTKTDSSTIDAGSAKGSQGPAGIGSGWTVTTDNDSTTISYALANGAWRVYGNSSITSLTITNGFSAVGQTAMVEFASPSTATTYTAPASTLHYGDSCSSGTFTPEVSTRYLMTYLNCGGGIRCFVKTI